jgi:hypothetical protein
MNILERLHEQGIVTKALVDKVREESDTLLRQWGPETPTDASTPS